MKRLDTDRPRTRPHTPRRIRRRGVLHTLALALLACAVVSVARPTTADIAQTIDHGDLAGRVTVDAQGRLTVTDLDGSATTMDLADVHRVVMGDNLTVRGGDLLLLDAAASANPTASTTIKLRAGLHHIVLPYWQGTGQRQLELAVSGPGFTGGEVPPAKFYCFREDGAEPQPSIGIDEQGFRLPELPLSAVDDEALRRRIRYTYLVGEGEGQWNDFSVFSKMTRRRGGVAGGITYRMAGQSEHFGILFHGFIQIDEDAEYTFTLTADDGARLYFGQSDQFTAAIPPTVDAPEWVALTHYGTRLSGKLSALTADAAELSVPVNEERDLALTIRLDQIAELWAADVDPATVDRGNESATDDTAYIRDRENPENVLKVPGTLVGLDAEKLRFDYRGQVRQINRSRVMGLVLRSADRAYTAPEGYHQSLHLKSGQSFPGRLVGIDERSVSFELTGAAGADGASGVTLPRSDVFMVRNELGRVLDVTAIEPTAVEEVPYFDHVIPYRVGEAFDGRAIELYDGKEYAHGISVHSRSRLHYRLDGGYVRFEAGVGLLKPGGRLGSVTVRVLGDGKVLWEREDVTPADGRVAVEADLTGVDRMILEVDFGQGQNVGDRAAWVDPQLIRDSVE